MVAEDELKKIESVMAEINRKLDALLDDRETLALMSVSERSLKSFFSEEPDLYSIEDVKVRY
ncbi:hypothetical protein AKJ50_00535 [candidate division MSBL1 archaeon SCGC-AAA382A13]|uniref:Uncharacterized protein n=1 Tax=candidate division MSBL1 archaeon SCGC-AAA382A13 TaxID=1698279 RepID=A0A133VGK6_9EURY|nr:hypothetical protein AKJ50_00535 [candidate division MSBL1 archaeon SCGC-AAA382A13]